MWRQPLLCLRREDLGSRVRENWGGPRGLQAGARRRADRGALGLLLTLDTKFRLGMHRNPMMFAKAWIYQQGQG